MALAARFGTPSFFSTHCKTDSQHVKVTQSQTRGFYSLTHKQWGDHREVCTSGTWYYYSPQRMHQICTTLIMNLKNETFHIIVTDKEKIRFSRLDILKNVCKLNFVFFCFCFVCFVLCLFVCLFVCLFYKDSIWSKTVVPGTIKIELT